MKTRQTSGGLVVAALLALAVLSPMAAEAIDQDIAWYGKAKGQPPHSRARIWLMEQDGSNPLYVYETCGWSSADWSPDGSSLVIRQGGFRDVPGFDGVLRLDLTDPPTEPSTACPDDLLPRIADGAGTLADSAFSALNQMSYEEVWGAKWSPMGGEVAIHVYGPQLDGGAGLGTAIAVADPDVLCEPVTGVGTCQQLVPIYYKANAVIWGFDWSPDGTELLVLQDVIEGNDIRAELAIVNRGSGDVSGSWRVDSVTPAEVDGMESPAWAPTVPGDGYTGPVVAFYDHVLVGRNKMEPRVYLLDLGVTSPMAVEIGVGSAAAWSPDGLFLAVRGKDDEPQRIEVATGAVVDLGDFWFAWNPDWKPITGSSGCIQESECDDGNPCTNDYCIGGECSNPANSASCDDNNPCTFGDVCSEGRCNGVVIEDGSSSDCVGWCCSGECLPGADECPACRPRGAECFFDDECCSGQCHVIKFTCK